MEPGRLDEQLKALPAKPGVYLFKDSAGKVLYVGKAASLRHRVRSYSGPPSTLVPKVRKMVARAQDIDFIVADSEQEAMILECNLIKSHRPYYNVRLKDDKSYPYIKVSLNEEWPRVFLTRRFEDDGGRYFGPFASARSVHSTINLLKKIFRFCSPRWVITGRKPRPCFDYSIHRCVGACSGEIEKEEYREIIDQVVLFLEGKQDVILRDLKRKMEEASAALQFERAASLRDQLHAIESISEEQKVTSIAKDDEDVIAFAMEKNVASVQVFFIRNGKLIGREHFVLEGTRDEEPGQVMASFIQQFYGSAPDVPPRILLQTEPQDIEVINSWLEGKRGRRVSMKVPQRGEKKKLVDMVAENAAQVLEQMRITWLADKGKTAAALEELEELLHLPTIPGRIECYDISNIRGTSAVGSMVVFENGRPRTAHYRRFKIKTVGTIDDYAMMKEVLRRRFRRIKAQDGTQWAMLPNLVLIDGGKGHLTAALEVMNELDIDFIPLASLAKENEELFLPGAVESLILPRNSQALYLLQRVRDEAHRFAISYHVNVRRKAAMASALDVPGIGPKRKRALLKQFGSVRGIREASVEELAAVSGMTRPLAEKVKELL
ncbi:MAG: excinuclease ABC subunit UvrC [Chloroflexota bacterium]|nr:excinuclease ABC subunit UvrC [Chloroflexota bacterium]